MTLSFQAGRPIDTDAADDLRRRHRLTRRDPARRRADARPGRRDAARVGGGAPRGPGRADRGARDHRRGRRGGVLGRAPRRRATDRPGRRHRHRQQRLTGWTRARGRCRADWREMARSIVPLGLLALGAALPLLRLPVLVALVAGTSRWRSRRDAPGPLGVGGRRSRSRSSLCWSAPAGPAVAPSTAPTARASRRRRRSGAPPRPSSCSARWRCWPGRSGPPVRSRRPAAADAGALGRALVGRRVPGRRAGRRSSLGPILARPFFGEISYDVTVVGAIAPALVFAVANGTMEELAYRGALLGWSAKVIGVLAGGRRPGGRVRPGAFGLRRRGQRRRR